LVPAVRAALDQVDALEAVLTLFRESSELVRVNREAAAGPVPVSPVLLSVLSRSAELHAATGGAFDPTSTPLSRAWGFLARQGREPSAEEIEAARERVGMERVVLDEAAGTVAFSRPGVELNLGSIGKGWALDQVAAAAARSAREGPGVDVGFGRDICYRRGRWRDRARDRSGAPSQAPPLSELVP
jgi:thiamine biosynthesis lipoprotein